MYWQIVIYRSRNLYIVPTCGAVRNRTVTQIAYKHPLIAVAVCGKLNSILLASEYFSI
jgi:hypothetical protein